MSKTGISLTGDWRRLRGVMQRFAMTPEIVDTLIEAEANIIRQRVIATIKFNGFEPNADSTVRRKGFDKPLVESGVFGSVEGIVIDTIEANGKKYYIVKGNPNLTVDRDNETTYEQLAEHLEYGATTPQGADIPARPTFTTVHDQMRDELPKYIIQKLREEYRRF